MCSSVMIVVLYVLYCLVVLSVVFFFQAEDGIRDLVRSRGLGDVYKRQDISGALCQRSQGSSASAFITTVSSQAGVSPRRLLLSLIHI